MRFSSLSLRSTSLTALDPSSSRNSPFKRSNSVNLARSSVRLASHSKLSTGRTTAWLTSASVSSACPLPSLFLANFAFTESVERTSERCAYNGSSRYAYIHSALVKYVFAFTFNP